MSEVKTLEEKILELDKEENKVEDVIEEVKEEVKEEEKEEETTQEVSPLEEVITKEEKPVETTEYTPDFSFKVYDEEKQFDDKIKSYIKSQEDEDYFRDLFTRAEGLNVVKEKLDKYRNEANSYKSNLEEVSNKSKEVESTFNFFNSLINDGRNGNEQKVNQLLDSLDLPDEILGRVVLERLNMSPESKRVKIDSAKINYEKQQTQRREEVLAKRESEILMRDAEENLRNAYTSNKEVQEIANFVDSKLGEETFLDEVKDMGIWLDQEAERVARETNQAPIFATYEDVFNIVADKYKKFYQPQQNQPIPQIKKRIVTNNNNNTIPNVGSGAGNIPSSNPITSLDDIRKEFDSYVKGK